MSEETDEKEESLFEAPPVAEQELEQLRGGSALIEDQSQCPFRAFARRRLGAQTLDEPVVGLSSADRGSILHDAGRDHRTAEGWLRN